MPGRAASRGQLQFEFRSFGRAGPTRGTFLPAPIALLARTAARTPEVMVKVSGGASSRKGVRAHFAYIDRHGLLEVETDDGRTLQGKDAADLADDWDLDASESRNRAPYRGTAGRAPGKLVHNVIFSMPKGTSADKLRSAVKAFARAQFALKHRYALVLHTDQDHPHVHVVLKAVSEEGRRLNIRKATLREWRELFAAQLRAHGVAANATPRALRGQNRTTFKDSIYRAARRGQSHYLCERMTGIAQALRSGSFKAEEGKDQLLQTRRTVVAGWLAAAEQLQADGRGALAEKIRGFVDQMRPPLTTDQQLAAKLLHNALAREQEKGPRAR